MLWQRSRISSWTLGPAARKFSGRFTTDGRSVSNLSISRKVKDALDRNLPVVCLESTIITHGMAYPANLRMARAVEKVVADNGAVPATIAFLDGQPCVGLEDADLEFLARTGRQARKISRRDMAACIADRATGGTTVSGTMILARMAGIKLFVTGGIGGVHRGAESTMDISNDLNELSRNDVAVVCAGPKAILDIPLTLEYLETMGVTVTTIGQDNLPAFYSCDSGIRSPQVSQSPEHAAHLIAANRQLGLGSAVLICVPIPPSASIDSKEMRSVIDAALTKAKSSDIKGKDSTPFLLNAVSEATKGRSLEANISLVLENARVGAQIAVHLSQLEKETSEQALKQIDEVDSTEMSETKPLSPQASRLIAESLSGLESGRALQEDSVCEGDTRRPSILPSDILVIGGVAVDVTCQIKPGIEQLDTILYTSTPGTVNRTLGGVACNLARAVAGTGTSTTLCSVIGGQLPHENITDDPRPDVDGAFVLDELKRTSLSLAIATIPGSKTATYTAVQARGELLLAVADMDIFSTSSQTVTECLAAQDDVKAIIFDANIPETVSMIAKWKNNAAIVCFEPTSTAKATEVLKHLFEGRYPSQTSPQLWPENVINTITPNVHELRALFTIAQEMSVFESQEWWTIINTLDIDANFRPKLEQFLRRHKRIQLKLAALGVVQQAVQLLPIFENIYLTLGSSGVISFHLRAKESPEFSRGEYLLIQRGQDCVLYLVYHHPIDVHGPIVTDTGAGDTFAGVLVNCLVKKLSIVESVNIAQRAAVLTLQSEQSVSPHIKELF